MASVNIDVDLSDKEAQNELEFQDLAHDSITDKQTHRFNDFPDTAEDDEDDKAELLAGERKSLSFWSFEYYQQFFDVETYTVLSRILFSMLPRPRRNYLKTIIRPNPDLYGPFWVCTTLIFSIAIVGNIITLFHPDESYVYSFDKVTFAATAIYGYWWVIPCLLFLFVWWRGNLINYTFLEIICLYGYSLSIFIPVSILCIIPIPIVRWLLTEFGALFSGSVLVLTFLPLLREEKRQIGIAILAVMLALHVGLATVFVLYFFHPHATMVPYTGNSSATVMP